MPDDVRREAEVRADVLGPFSELMRDHRYIDDLSYQLAYTLKMEPAAIEGWLKDFADVIRKVELCGNKLMLQSGNLDGDVRLGSFEPSQQIKEKMKARFSEGAGGFAWSVNSVVLGLSEIHEKLRLSLQSHLKTDFSSSQVFGKIGDPNVEYKAGDAANS